MSGISYEDVAQAASELIADDENLTIENVSVRKVREKVGGGSMGTIASFLREFKEKQTLVPDAPEALRTMGGEFVDNVFAAAMGIARRELESERSQMWADLLDEMNLLERRAEEMKIIEVELAGAREQVRDLRNENERLIDEANRLTAAHADEKDRADELAKDNLELERKYAELSGQMSVLLKTSPKHPSTLIEQLDGDTKIKLVDELKTRVWRSQEIKGDTSLTDMMEAWIEKLPVYASEDGAPEPVLQEIKENASRGLRSLRDSVLSPATQIDQEGASAVLWLGLSGHTGWAIDQLWGSRWADHIKASAEEEKRS